MTRHCRNVLGDKHSDKRKERKVSAADSNDVVGGLQEILKKTRELLKKKTTPASTIIPKNAKSIPHIQFTVQHHYTITFVVKTELFDRDFTMYHNY